MIHHFIINPAAGSYDRTREYADAIEKACREHGIDCRISVSAAPGDCTRIAAEAVQSGQPVRLYACGGDGTLNEVVAGAAGFDNAAVTVYSGGSGNDFTKLFSDPDAFRDIDRLLDSEEVTFDLIRCNEDLCLNICSVGLDARIGTDVANYKRIPFFSGFRAYAVSALINTVRGVSAHYRVEINGQVFDGEQTMICICNGRYYGGGFNPVPDADPTDGYLDVLLVKGVTRRKVLTVIGKYKAGNYDKLPDIIQRFRTKQVTILCDEESAVNLDGELRMAKKIEIGVADKTVRFFYPRGLTWRVPEKALTQK